MQPENPQTHRLPPNERFFIIIEHHNLKEIIANVESRGDLADGENFSIRYRLQNYGKTPGIIRELTLNSMIATDPVDRRVTSLSSRNLLNA